MSMGGGLRMGAMTTDFLFRINWKEKSQNMAIASDWGDAFNGVSADKQVVVEATD